jgi:sugar (pentulose or hexulose) kinase
MLGAVGVAVQPDLRSAIVAMTRIERALEPDPATAEVYDRAFTAYTALYPAVAPIMRSLRSPGPPL